MATRLGVFVHSKDVANDQTTLMDIQDTLANAKQVLKTHREQLKRRSGRVSPLVGSHDLFIDSPLKETSQWIVEDDIEEEQIEENHVEERESGPEKVGGSELKSPPSDQVVPLFPKSAWNETPLSNEHILVNNDISASSTEPTTRKRRLFSRSAVIVPVLQDKEDVVSEKKIHSTSVTDIFISPSSDDKTSASNEECITDRSTASVNKSLPEDNNTAVSFEIQEHQDNTLDSSNEGSTEISEAELLEYQQFLKRLQSSSSGTVVTVAPAPSSHRSSYLHHKKSKIGIENIALPPSAKPDPDKPVHSTSQTSFTSLRRQSSTPSTTTIHVLPSTDETLSSTMLVTRETKEKRKKKRPRNKIAPIPNDVPSTTTPPTQDNDLILEDTNDWIPPLQTISHTLSSKESSDIVVSEVTTNDVIPSKSTVPQTTGSPKYESQTTGSPKYESQTVNSKHESQAFSLPLSNKKSDIILSDVVNDEPINFTSKKKGLLNFESKKTSDIEITEVKDQPARGRGRICLPPIESTDLHGITVGDTRAKKESTAKIKKDSKMKRDTKNKEELSVPLTKIEDDIKIEKDPETIKDIEDTTMAEVTREKTKFETEAEFEEDNDCEDQSMPLLRVKSTLSLNFSRDYVFQRKRERTTPTYSIHRPSNQTILPPACPLYGTIQPTETEVLSTSLRRVSKRKSPSNIFTGREIHTKLSLTTENDLQTFDDHVVSTTTQPVYSLMENEFRLQLEYSALHKAAREGNVRQVQTLITQGHDVNSLDAEYRTPLMYCVLPTGQVQLACADLLIRKGANIDHQAIDGSTALHYSSYVGAVSFMELLLLNGANPDIRDISDRLPLHWSTKPPSIKPITILLKHSLCSDINVVDNCDMTPLMWACYNKNVTVTKYLTDHEADCEEKDIDGKTAMHWAASQCDLSCLQLLLKSDQTYFKDRIGRTVLHCAAAEGFIKGIQYIISLRGDSVHDTDKMGRTPLHYAAANDHVDVCYLLLNHGADATQKDAESKTPLDYGLIKQNEYVVALFTCHDVSIGDFSKQQRTKSRTSFITDETEPDDIDSFISESTSPIMFDTLSQQTFTNESERFVKKGSYLGYFTDDNNSPPLHYYFWMNSKNKTLCWSRSSNRHNKTESSIVSVHSGPSQLVQQRPDYSPDDLHIFVFWIITKVGILDLLAYSKESFEAWMECLQYLSEKDSVQKIEEVSVDTESEKSVNYPQTSTPLPPPIAVRTSSQLHANEVI